LKRAEEGRAEEFKKIGRQRRREKARGGQRGQRRAE
jgi:hypothetical protein